ncbi:MAG: A24 family peptidase [Gammaproteobacteria bacterium]|nr:A24 family peptidase [Gammaproteobacteria bacterium]
MEQMLTPLTTILLCGMLGLAVWSDIHEHRISNWLVIAVLITGLVAQVSANGPMGILFALGGLATGLLFFLPFYIRGGMGAGDVKLMGAAGSMLGPLGAVMACALALIAGLVLVIAAVQFRNFVMQYRMSRAAENQPVTDAGPNFLVEKNGATRIPYAPAIAAGCGIALWQLGYLSTLGSLVG